MDRLGIGVIGYGYWGGNYARVFSEMAQTRLAGLCDASTARLQEARRRYPEAVLSADVTEMLANPGIDAVVVCTPASVHAEVVRQVLESGRCVLVEKPMTTTSADAMALIDLAAARQLTLMVGHTFIYNSGVRKVKSYITEDQIGRVYYLYARRTNLGPIRRDVNALWDLAPHDISIFNYLLDCAPEWVSAVGARVLRNGLEDVGFISLGYPDDVVGHAHLSWADPQKVRELVVVGSDKRVVFDDMNPLERVRVYEKGVKGEPDPKSFGEYHLLLRDGDIIIPRVDASEPLKNQAQHFVECVINKAKPMTDGRSGLDVVRVMEAVDLSVARRGAPVEVTQEVR